MPLASLARLCARTSLALLIAGVPARAGGPTFHLAAARHALDRIQDPELRALLRIDEIVEMSTPWDQADHYATLRFAEAGGRLFLFGRAFDGLQTWMLETNGAWRILSRKVSHFDLAGNFIAVDAPPITPTSGLPGAKSVVPTLPRTLHVVQLGAIPATLGVSAPWTWSPLLTRSGVESVRFGGDTRNRSAGGLWWLTTKLEDGSSITYGRQGYLKNTWRQILLVAKERQPAYDSRVEVLVPTKSTIHEELADRRAVLIDGDLYLKDVW